MNSPNLQLVVDNNGFEHLSRMEQDAVIFQAIEKSGVAVAMLDDLGPDEIIHAHKMLDRGQLRLISYAAKNDAVAIDDAWRDHDKRGKLYLAVN